jgi:hypothetical protein
MLFTTTPCNISMPLPMWLVTRNGASLGLKAPSESLLLLAHQWCCGRLTFFSRITFDPHAFSLSLSSAFSGSTFLKAQLPPQWIPKGLALSFPVPTPEEAAGLWFCLRPQLRSRVGSSWRWCSPLGQTLWKIKTLDYRLQHSPLAYIDGFPKEAGPLATKVWNLNRPSLPRW